MVLCVTCIIRDIILYKMLSLENQSEQNSEIRPSNTKRTLIVAKELNILKNIVSNNIKERSYQMKKLPKWISVRSSQKSIAFTESDFERIWNALYYYVWMSDKPLPQEEANEKISSLLDHFSCTIMAIQFYSTFLQTMCRKWIGIDQWRMDKFLMVWK